MKAYFWIPIACLVGVLIGAWGPRGEIREMKRLAEERKSLPKNAAAEGFQAFAKLANIPDEAKRPRRRRGKEKPLFSGGTNRVARGRLGQSAPPGAPGRLGQATPPGATTPTNVPAAVEEKRRFIPAGDLRARLEEAQELWRTRVEIARANWKAKLKVKPADEARFNAALDEMNEQLHGTMNSLAQLIAEKGKVTSELGLRLVGDATTIMAETYEKVGACTSSDLRETVSDMPMTDFIDPGVAEPLVGVQDMFEHFPGRR